MAEYPRSRTYKRIVFLQTTSCQEKGANASQLELFFPQKGIMHIYRRQWAKGTQKHLNEMEQEAMTKERDYVIL
jgi:hypothetical protein